jgi:hypothetical protein
MKTRLASPSGKDGRRMSAEERCLLWAQKKRSGIDCAEGGVHRSWNRPSAQFLNLKIGRF